MSNQRKVIAFDVDPESLAGLWQALPDWQIEIKNGASTGSLDNDWNPGRADLLVVRAGNDDSVTLGLCRGLRSQAGRAVPPYWCWSRVLGRRSFGPCCSREPPAALSCPSTPRNCCEA